MLFVCTAATINVDYVEPLTTEFHFVEGDENGKIQCLSFTAVDDNDFETLEEIYVFLDYRLISPAYTVWNEPFTAKVIINDTGGIIQIMAHLQTT